MCMLIHKLGKTNSFWEKCNNIPGESCLQKKALSDKIDTGYPHDGRADKDSYPHDRRADKDSYPHDRRADKDSYPHDRHNQYITITLC